MTLTQPCLFTLVKQWPVKLLLQQNVPIKLSSPSAITFSLFKQSAGSFVTFLCLCFDLLTSCSLFRIDLLILQTAACDVNNPLTVFRFKITQSALFVRISIAKKIFFPSVLKINHLCIEKCYPEPSKIAKCSREEEAFEVQQKR